MLIKDLTPILGIHFHAITETRCVRHIFDELDENRGGWVVTANLDHLRRLVNGSSYGTLCQQASMIVVDGRPLLWASWLHGKPLPGQVAGSSLVISLSEEAEKKKRSVFLLGGIEGAAEAAAAALQRKYPSLRIAGTYCPEIGFERDEQAMFQLMEALCSAKPDIVYVALGSPKQEELIHRLRGKLPNAWWVGVGITFSYLSGHIRRAPTWMQKTGLEWLYRLIQEPRRLARRYLIDDLPFAVFLFGKVLVQRLKWFKSRKGT